MSSMGDSEPLTDTDERIMLGNRSTLSSSQQSQSKNNNDFEHEEYDMLGANDNQSILSLKNKEKSQNGMCYKVDFKNDFVLFNLMFKMM